MFLFTLQTMSKYNLKKFFMLYYNLILKNNSILFILEQIKSYKTLIKNRIKNLILITDLFEQNLFDDEIIETIQFWEKCYSQNE